MNKEERRKHGLDTLNPSAVILYSMKPKKTHTQQETQNTSCVKEKKTKQNKIYITENEYKKINKSNIMYKINYSYSYISFLANQTKKEINSYNSETRSTNIIFTLLSKNWTACTDALI